MNQPRASLPAGEQMPDTLATGSGSREVGGFHAGVVQHEFDHLDGILYPMRMTDFSLFGFAEDLAKAGL